MAENKNITLNLKTTHADYLESIDPDDLDFIIRTGIYTLNETKKLAKSGGIIPVKRAKTYEINESTRLMRRMLSFTGREYKRNKSELKPYTSNKADLITKPIENLSSDFAKFSFNFETK